LRDISHRCEYLFVLALSKFIRVLPLHVARGLGDFLGDILFRVIRIRREVTLVQLQEAFPNKTPRELLKCGRACYRNIVNMAVELIRLGDADLHEMSGFFQVKGLRLLDEALKAGRGLVMVTFHFGNWELVGAYISRLGYPLNVVVQRIHNPFIDRMISEMRLGAGMKTIPRSSALKESLRALDNNNIVIFLADQDAHDSGVFVPFFHQSASTPRGPAVIALRRDVPAVMTFVVRREDGIFEINFEPILYEREGDLETDVEGFTRTFTSRLEEYVRKHPDQWLWLHKRWKTVATGAI